LNPSVTITGRERLFLAVIPASHGQRVAAGIAIVASAMLFVLTAAFGHIELPASSAFIPAYEGALSVIAFVTFIILFGHYLRVTSPAVLWLALAYLFLGLIIIPHVLTFPGVFSPTGLLGAGSQTTAWLFTFWHGGFPGFAIVYFLAPHRPDPKIDLTAAKKRVAIGASAVVLLVVGIVMLTTKGGDLLPVVVEAGNYRQMVTKGISPAMMLICMAAISVGYWRRRLSVLDLWVTLVMGVWILDIAMSSVLGSSRYDLGWYMGRAFDLVAGTSLLGLLLLESNKLYHYLAEALDLADQRNSELVRSKEALARAQRLDAMGQLTGGVAHDFNNVLQIISANLHVLRLRRPEDPQVQDSIRRALEGVKRGGRLSSELLSFASKQPLQPKVMNISQLLTSMDDILRHTLGAAVDIETVIAGGLWNTLVDAALLENAILNLALNGRDAMRGSGKLTIEALNASLDDEYVQGTGDAIVAGQYVVVAVTDTGTGISEEVLDRIFEPFFTTKPVGSGTGLGLSMVYGFVKQSHGYVRIYSELGVGTTVKIYLPRSHDTKTSRLADSTFELLRGEERILVVEDDEAVRLATVETLDAMGYKVHSAQNAAEADALLEGGLVVDLLFTDIVMPGPLKATEMAARAVRRLPKLVVLYTSGYTENAIVHGGRLDPGVRLISKPYRAEQLSALLRRLLEPPAAGASID
jgi:signal transduction histidine kinase